MLLITIHSLATRQLLIFKHMNIHRISSETLTNNTILKCVRVHLYIMHYRLCKFIMCKIVLRIVKIIGSL